jgi:hypothetical protein
MRLPTMNLSRKTMAKNTIMGEKSIPPTTAGIVVLIR